MHFLRISSLAAALATFAIAAPHPQPELPTRVDRLKPRQAAPSTYTCVMNAVVTNGEIVGGGEPKRRSVNNEERSVKEKRQDPDDFPSAGGSVDPDTFFSSMGITVGIAGATHALWSSDSFDVWDINAQTISGSTTGLPMDISYAAAGTTPTFGCSMAYNGVEYDCVLGGSVQILGIGSEGIQTGQVEFPCVMTPPGEGSSGYAPGWCGIHVTQYQKPDPATDPYTLDVSVYDNDGIELTSVSGAVTSATLDSALPYTVDVGTGAVDADPVTFAYGGDTWDSTSTANQCSVGAYDSGSRQMDCGFTC